MSAYVEPILKLFITKTITDNLFIFEKIKVLIDNSIDIKINRAKNIVLMDLSNKKEIKLFVK